MVQQGAHLDPLGVPGREQLPLPQFVRTHATHMERPRYQQSDQKGALQMVGATWGRRCPSPDTTDDRQAPGPSYGGLIRFHSLSPEATCTSPVLSTHFSRLLAAFSLQQLQNQFLLLHSPLGELWEFCASDGQNTNEGQHLSLYSSICHTPTHSSASSDPQWQQWPWLHFSGTGHSAGFTDGCVVDSFSHSSGLPAGRPGSGSSETVRSHPQLDSRVIEKL